MAKIITAGDDVDFKCTKCKLLLAHTIIAMVDGEPARVKCNTCHTERNWKRAKRKKATTTKKRATKTTKVDPNMSVFEKQNRWKALMETAVGKKASRRAYSFRETFQGGQILEHKKFGDGIVIDIRTGGKMIVCFLEGDKLLVHERA